MMVGQYCDTVKAFLEFIHTLRCMKLSCCITLHCSLLDDLVSYSIKLTTELIYNYILSSLHELYFW